MPDPLYLAFLVAGMSGGAYIGYRINLWRVQTNAPAARDLNKHSKEPARSAGLMGLAAFAGVAIANDAHSMLGEPRPDLVVLKYLFAAVIGTAHYILLKRISVGR